MATKRALVWKIRYQTSGTRLLAPREKTMRGLPSSHGWNLKILMFGDQMLFKLYVPLPAILTLHHGEHGLLLLNYLMLITHYCPTEGDFRFQSVDSKLSIVLQNMVDAAGEVAYDVKVKIGQRSQELGKKGNFLMGREIFAMILNHFRTTSKDEVLFNASHICRLQYRGDKEMDKFLNAWLEIIAKMKPEDIPSEVTLRDHLLRKIEGSQALRVDLTIFKSREKDDKKKTYQELLEIMKRYIARVREDKNIAARDKFATDYTNFGKPTTPAPKPAAHAPDPKGGKTGKPSAPADSCTQTKVSLELLYSHPAIRRVMARATARAVGDRDYLLPEIRRRPFAIFTSTGGTANMVTNANTVTRSTIGTRGTRMVRKVVGGQHRQGDPKLLEERKTVIAMDGPRVAANVGTDASSNMTPA